MHVLYAITMAEVVMMLLLLCLQQSWLTVCEISIIPVV